MRCEKSTQEECQRNILQRQVAVSTSKLHELGNRSECCRRYARSFADILAESLNLIGLSACAISRSLPCCSKPMITFLGKCFWEGEASFGAKAEIVLRSRYLWSSLASACSFGQRCCGAMFHYWYTSHVLKAVNCYTRSKHMHLVPVRTLRNSSTKTLLFLRARPRTRLRWCTLLAHWKYITLGNLGSNIHKGSPDFGDPL